MSVFSSRFFFVLGSGARCFQLNVFATELRRQSISTFLVLLHVEASQQHDCFLAVYATIGRIWRINVRAGPFVTGSLRYWMFTYILRVDGQDTTSTTKSIVRAAIVYSPDSELPQCRRAHDAWLYSDIQVGLLED